MWKLIMHTEQENRKAKIKLDGSRKMPTEQKCELTNLFGLP